MGQLTRMSRLLDEGARKQDALREDDSPPTFSDATNGFTLTTGDITTSARVTGDGQIAISLTEKSHRFSSHFDSLFEQQNGEQVQEQPPGYEEEESSRSSSNHPRPALNVLIQVVGSRGDIQPFVAFGVVLKRKWNHRVRIATHPTFRDLVEENSLEFFDIGGDPAKLMAYMVKHPGLFPGFDTITKGQVTEHRQAMRIMLDGFWKSCIATVEDSRINTAPFIADIIIANPPSFGHVHCAQKLGIPLQIMFTMPWSPTRSFPHPLASIEFSNMNQGAKNYLSYALVEALVWQGLGDVVNDFRTKTLGLQPVSFTAGSTLQVKNQLPHIYCWSPTLIPKPADWGTNISVSGFCFLPSASDYVPEPILAKFLASGPKPIYIGFGSIVVDDPGEMTSIILEAIRRTGQRAIISQGWAKLGVDSASSAQDVLFIGNVPHDWIFPQVSCVVHHGGAGTTAAGIAAGKPTVIVPFFGDQPFWGAMIARSGAGPAPIPKQNLLASTLADAIMLALQPSTVEQALRMSRLMALENGVESSAQAFHQAADLELSRCSVSPQHIAIWKIKRADFRLSALSAAVLLQERILKLSDLQLLRHKEYNLEPGTDDPFTAAITSTFGGVGNVIRGLASIGLEPVKAVRLETQRSVTSPQMEPALPVRSNISPSSRSGTESQDYDGVDEKSLSAKPATLTEDMQPTKQLSRQQAEKQSTESKMATSSKSPSDSSLNVVGSAAKGLGVGLVKGSTLAVLHAAATPFDVIAATTRGLHNAPKLYGDDTVRPLDQINGVGSGLKSAGKALGLGFYDGVTGLVSQPIEGAKKEGPKGFAKGFMKGALGIGFKPTAGALGMFSYTYEGMRQEIHQMGIARTAELVRASRLAQGFQELRDAPADEQERVLTSWHRQLQLLNEDNQRDSSKRWKGKAPVRN